ncbi:hypothetical protein [Guptibacillus hwajinpoensis]|uniref:hypothetical protein n=1 Tax=Guptibacillus hwajinpoensis TaxID=208199 RepID=UPI003D0053F1
MFRFLVVGLVTIILGDVIQTTALNIWASAVVGNLPILGEYFTFLNLKDLLEEIFSLNRSTFSLGITGTVLMIHL